MGELGLCRPGLRKRAFVAAYLAACSCRLINDQLRRLETEDGPRRTRSRSHFRQFRIVVQRSHGGVSKSECRLLLGFVGVEGEGRSLGTLN